MGATVQNNLELKEFNGFEELIRNYIKLAYAEGLLVHFRFLRFLLDLYGKYLKARNRRKIEEIYRKYKDNPLLRNSMTSVFMKLLEESSLSEQDLRSFIEKLELKEEIEKLIMEDLEEAIENISLKRSLDERREDLEQAISQFRERLNALPSLQKVQ